MAKNSTPYLNLQTDFGFKYVFGSERNKNVMIRFLNALFSGKLVVNDIIYHDKEILPSEERGKRIVYDVYCTALSAKNESFFFPSSQKNGERRERNAITYRDAWERKLKRYLDMGFEEGETLFVTKDNPDGSFNSEEVMNVINEIKKLMI